MNLACVQCAKPLADGAASCASCGRPTDADNDGVPDALDKLIEAKAKGILAAERQAEAEALEKKALDDKVQSERLAREDEIRHLKEWDVILASRLATNESLARSGLGLFLDTAKRVAIIAALAWMTVGIGVHFMLFGIVSYSPAGYVACPMQCETCTGPGRVFLWSQKGGSLLEKGRGGYALVCHNPSVDADTLTAADVHGFRNASLQPYMVSGWTSFAVEGVMIGGLATLLFGFTRTRKRRRSLGEEHADLERKRTRGRTRLAELSC